jgi:ATP-dependent helicase/nuclease subunit A
LAGGSQDELLGNKLFIVGDPKQSIYRFRGADVSVFDRVAKDIEAHGGKRVVLDENFRSVKGLLTVFNELFAELMGTEYDTTVPFAPLAAIRDGLATNNLSCVELLTIDPENSGNAEARQVEAKAVAAHIQQMVAKEGYLLDTEQGPRRLEYRDVAILFASTTHQAVYEAALQAYDVPYYVLGGRNFYQRQEIVDVINLLKVIDNHHDATALAGVLRSPLFLLADDTLAYLQLQAGSIWAGLGQPAILGQLALDQRAAAMKAWELLNRLRRLQGLVPIAELISLALNETSYDTFTLTQFMGVQQYANIHKLIGLARQYQTTEAATLSDFLRYVVKLMEDGAQEGEAQIESEQGNTVKLMTVHSAKGLEFPVVLLPDVDRTFKYDAGSLLFDEELGLGLKLRSSSGDWQITSRHQLVAQREKQLSLLEMKRLLYVAMTRAKDRLVLSTSSSIIVDDKKIQALAGKDFTTSAIGRIGW